jgi:predicted permease
MNNNVIVVLRSLRRQREFSLLNVLGLGVGIGAALLLFLLIRNELSFDTYHSKLDRVYRVVSTETYRSGLMDYDGDAPAPLVEALRREFPEVEAAADVIQQGMTVTIPGQGGSNKTLRAAAAYVDPALFQILDLPWLQGNPRTALQDIQTMAISKTIAETWFGDWRSAMGKVVLMNDDRTPFRITGILADPRPNTDVPVSIALSFATFINRHPGIFTDPMNWDNFSSGVQCYFLIRKGATIASMNRRLPSFVAEHYTPLFEHSDSRDSSFFQPFKEMHFDSQLDHPGKPGLSYNELLSLGLVGCFLLLVACINFVNLATALSVNRAREVGVRKVLGSSRKQLLWRFLGETGVLVLCGAMIGCILAEIALNPICRMLDEEIAWSALFAPSSLLFLVVTMLLVTGLAGLYPGLILSGFNPIGALKSKISPRTIGGISLRRGLVVFQFVIAQLLIIGTLVVVRQMNYFKSRPMGFQKNAIVLVDMPFGGQHNATFKQQVLQIPGVRAVSLCNGAPATDGIWSSGFSYDRHVVQEGFEAIYKFGDADFLSTFQIPLVAGRTPYPSDTVHETVVNEALVRSLGIHNPATVIGKTIRLSLNNGTNATIVGVARDFVTTSMKDKIKPLVLSTSGAQYYQMALRVDPDKITQVVPQVQELFTKAFPDHLWDLHFLDDQIAASYNAEANTAVLFKVFAGLAILISCLGLYGLVSFMAAQKTKEVGIRKVLGASVQSIVYLFSKEFTLLVAVAFALAAPLGYYVMHRWLQGFYFQTSIGWDIFALSIAGSIAIAWATVAYRAVRAALADPVKALKYE